MGGNRRPSDGLSSVETDVPEPNSAGDSPASTKSAGEVAESSSQDRAKKALRRMCSRHLELLKNLSDKNREKEEKQKREEQRMKRREGLLRDRLLSQSGGGPQPGGRSSSQPAAAQASEAVEVLRDARTRSVRERADSQRALKAQQQEVRQQRRSLSEKRSHPLDGGQKPALRDYMDSKGKPRALPKLPTASSSAASTAPLQNRTSPLPSQASDTLRQSDSLSSGTPVARSSKANTMDTRGLSRSWNSDVGLAEGPAERQEEQWDDEGTASLSATASAALRRGVADAEKPKLDPRRPTPPHEMAGEHEEAQQEEQERRARFAEESKAEASAGGASSSSKAASGASPSPSLRQANAGARKSVSKAAPVSVDKFFERMRSVAFKYPCDDLQDWKRRNGCSPDDKVFICCGGYPDFRDALLRRGWVENPDKNSRHFDVKWGMVSNIDYENLRPFQMVNHFDRCRDLTTKVGLTLNLRNAPWLAGADPDAFYPRAYDLYDPVERADFVYNFKMTKAESILRRFLEQVDGKEEQTFSQDVIWVAHKMCQRAVTDADDVMDCPELAEGLGRVTAGEWALLDRVCLDDASERVTGGLKDREINELVAKRSASTVLRTREPTARELEKEAEKRKAERENETKKERRLRRKNAAEVKEAKASEVTAKVADYDKPRGQHMIRQARGVIQELWAKNRQFTLNGSRNAWIVKPSGKSRGRGIQMIRELDAIFRATELDGFKWICQKYIESPQLVHGYKFDIRQWVLVVDWNPLTLYVWRQPYIRFAGEKYDESCTNRSEYMHLVNNSIVKNMDGFYARNDELQTSGFMWFRQQYEEWLHRTYCKCEKHHTPFLKPPPYTCDTYGVRWEDVKFIAKDEEDEDEDDDDEAAPEAKGSTEPPAAPAASPAVAPEATVHRPDVPTVPDPVDENYGEDACVNLWATCVKPQINEIILNSLLSVQDQVAHRKNSVELYGYDFMFSQPPDEELPRVWLIEVNSSPACDYSTPITCPLVKKMMEDTAKIMVDQRENPSTDTGEWELLHHAFNKPMVQRACHEKLEVMGIQIKPPKAFRKKKKKKKAKKAEAPKASQAEPDDDGGDDDGDGDDAGEGGEGPGSELSDGEDDEGDDDSGSDM